MELYHSLTSPYSRKVRVFLREKGLRAAEVDIRTSGRKASEVNPLGKVPTLVLESGLALFDSRVIIDTLDHLHPHPVLIPGDPMARARVRRFEALADGLCDVLIPIVVETARPAEVRNEAQIAKLTEKVRAVLAELDRAALGSPYLEGGRFSLADIAVIAALGYCRLRRQEFLEGDYSSLLEYEARLLERPSLKETIPPDLPVMG